MIVPCSIVLPFCLQQLIDQIYDKEIGNSSFGAGMYFPIICRN